MPENRLRPGSILLFVSVVVISCISWLPLILLSELDKEVFCHLYFSANFLNIMVSGDPVVKEALTVAVARKQAQTWKGTNLYNEVSYHL